MTDFNTKVRAGTISKQMDSAAKSSGRGSISSSLYSIFRGFNHQFPGQVNAPGNIEHQGYTFFVKPTTNMSQDNVTTVGTLDYLADNDPNSLGCAIANMLSADCGAPNIRPSAESAIVDNKSPFIPLLSNTLLELNGWPDRTADLKTSAEGIAGESQQWVDGRGEWNKPFPLTASFRNIEGDPVRQFLFSLYEYQTKVSHAAITTSPSFILDKTIDYNIGIHRITTDMTLTYINYMGYTPGGIVVSSQDGSPLNVSQDVTTGSDRITVPFSANVILYQNPLQVIIFNSQVSMCNPAMKNRKANYRKLKGPEKLENNYRGYPWIAEPEKANGYQYELEWWV